MLFHVVIQMILWRKRWIYGPRQVRWWSGVSSAKPSTQDSKGSILPFPWSIARAALSSSFASGSCGRSCWGFPISVQPLAVSFRRVSISFAVCPRSSLGFSWKKASCCFGASLLQCRFSGASSWAIRALLRSAVLLCRLFGEFYQGRNRRLLVLISFGRNDAVADCFNFIFGRPFEWSFREFS